MQILLVTSTAIQQLDRQVLREMQQCRNQRSEAYSLLQNSPEANFTEKTLNLGLHGGRTFSMQYFCSLCITKCHQFIGEIYVPRGPSVSFPAVRLLWTVVSQSFMTQWNFDERYK